MAKKDDKTVKPNPANSGPQGEGRRVTPKMKPKTTIGEDIKETVSKLRNLAKRGGGEWRKRKAIYEQTGILGTEFKKKKKKK